MLGNQKIGRGIARQPALELIAVLHATAVIFEKLARTGADRQLEHAGALGATGHAVQLGAAVLGLALRQAFEPVGAVHDDRRDVAQRLDVVDDGRPTPGTGNLRERRSEEQTSELQSLMRNSYDVFCLKNKKHT